MKNKFSLVAILAVLLGSQIARANTIEYPDFSDLSGFTLSGSAETLNPAGSVLNLTDGLNQAGTAFLTESIAIGANTAFSTMFQFRIDDPVGERDSDGTGADGLAFVMQTGSENVGILGGGIGYSGIPNSLGIEFDTWNNNAVDDYNGNHVGINLNGEIDSVLQQGVGTRMNDGGIWSVWVDYDGISDLLQVRIAEDTLRPDTATLEMTTDLTSTFGQTDVFIGFTSGTGAAGGDHDILNWTFTSELSPNVKVPLPSSLALLGLGLIGFRFSRSVRRG